MDKTNLVNYYKILGVSRNASCQEIKHRYYLLAKKYHPDHGKSEHKIYLINEAYQILSSPEKRELYDRMLESSENWQEIEYYLNVWDFFSKTLEIKFLRKEKCSECQGNGYTTPKPLENICPLCGGRGKVIFSSSESEFNTEKRCHLCKGTGSLNFHLCPKCQGKGIKEKQQLIKINPQIIETNSWELLKGGDYLPAKDDYANLRIKLLLDQSENINIIQNKIIIEEKVSVLEILLEEKKKFVWPTYTFETVIPLELNEIKLPLNLRYNNQTFSLYLKIKPFYPKLTPPQKEKIKSIIQELNQ